MATVKKPFSGARTQVRIGGKIVGWGVNLQVDETQNLTAVDVLDNPYTEELELNSVSVTGSMSVVVIYGDGIAEQKIFPQDENKAGLILFPEAQLAVVDSLTNQVLFTVHRLKFTGRSLSFTREGVAMSNVSFRAIRLESHNKPYGP